MRLLSLKTKLILLMLLIIVALGAVLFSVVKANQRLAKDNTRLTENIELQNFGIDTLLAKNGELAYTVGSLKVKNDEFAAYSMELSKKVENLKIKNKNLQSASEIIIKYVYVKDTTPLVQIPDTVKSGNKKFALNFDDKYIKIAGTVNIPKVKNPFIENLQVSVIDSLLFAEEIKYKGWWFWKRPVSMKLIIKSENPYFKLNKAQTYYFIDNKKP